MNLLSLIALAAEGEPQIFGINVGVSFWTLIVFGVLLYVLAKFAFPPILGYATAREERIQAALDDAKRQRAEAESQLEQQRQELVQARQQAQALIAEGKQAAERLREDMLVRARAEHEGLLERARQDIAREREAAIESLRREAIDLALAAAGKLISTRIDDAADRKLVTEYLNTVGDDGVRSAGVV